MATDPTPVSPGPQPGTPVIPSTPDDRTMALLCHLGGIIGGFILPLVIWLIKKDQSRFVDDQGKEALNFQLTMMIAYIVSGLSFLIVIGILLFPVVLIVNIVFSIIAGMAANQGQVYRYPFNIRMIK